MSNTNERSVSSWKFAYDEVGAFEDTRTKYYVICPLCGRKEEICTLDSIHSHHTKTDLEAVRALAYTQFPYCHCGAKMCDNGDTEWKNLGADKWKW